MGSLGVDADTTVVTYDDNNALVASRLWWVLNYYGHAKAKVLNGGWHRWLTEERAVTFHATRPGARTFESRTVPKLHASAEGLIAEHDSGLMHGARRSQRRRVGRLELAREQAGGARAGGASPGVDGPG